MRRAWGSAATISRGGIRQTRQFAQVVQRQAGRHGGYVERPVGPERLRTYDRTAPALSFLPRD